MHVKKLLLTWLLKVSSYQLSIIPRFCYDVFKSAKRMVKSNQDIIGA